MTASPKQSLRQTTLRKTHIQRQQALNGSIKDKKQTILAAPRRPLDPDIAMTDSTSDESHLQAAKSPKAQAAPQKRSKPAREVQRYHSQSLRVSPEELRLQKYEELGQFRDTPKGTLWWLAVSSQTSSQALMNQLQTETLPVKIGQRAERKVLNVQDTVYQKLSPLTIKASMKRSGMSAVKELDLSKHQADAMTLLIDFLYTGDFSPKLRAHDNSHLLDTTSESNVKHVTDLFELYCLVEMHNIHKSTIAKILFKLHIMRPRLHMTLDIMHKLYSRFPLANEGKDLKDWVSSYLTQYSVQ